MNRKKFFLGLLILTCMIASLGCQRDGSEKKPVDKQVDPDPKPIEGQEQDKDQHDKIIYGYIRNGSGEDFLLSEFSLVLENDASLIEKYKLSMADFDMGYVAYHREVGLSPSFEDFKVHEASKFYVLHYPDSIRYEMEDADEYGHKEVSREIFQEAIDEDYYGFYKVKIYLEDDRIARIEELDENEIFTKLYPLDEGPVLNNGGTFVKYQDHIYYREYRPDSFEKVSLWGDLEGIGGSKSNIVRLKADGSREVLFEDSSSGGFYIESSGSGKGRFIFNRSFLEPYAQAAKAYSLDLHGGNRQDYREDRISAKRGRLWHYDSTANQIYYQDEEMIDDDFPLNIIRGDLKTGENQMFFKPTREELEGIFEDDYIGEYFEIKNIRVSGDYFWAYIAGYAGSGYMYNNSALVRFAKDGGGYSYKRQGLAVDWYGLEKPFNQVNDGPFGLSIPSYHIYPREAPLGKKLVLSENDIRLLGYDNWPMGQGDFLEKIDCLEYVDDQLFFTVVSLKRKEDEDVGWRKAYERLGADVYRKDLESGEIEYIYSY